MSTLRTLVTESVYQDNPDFSDQLLLPAISTGQSVSIVAAFAPSYLMRLVNDLASSPGIEPGKLSVTFCIPSSLGPEVSRSRLLSLFLSAHAERAQDVKTALESMLQLTREGGLTLGALVSSDSKLLTPGCIGVVESGEFGSSDYLGFVDNAAGDFNSPISISTSWGVDSESLGNIAQVVLDARGKEYAHLERLNHSQVIALLNEVLQRGYPKHDIQVRDRTRSNDIKRKEKATPVRTKKSKLDEEPQDWEILAIEEEFSYDDAEYELVLVALESVSSRDGEYIFDFLGDPELGEEVAFLDLQEATRGHVGPLPSVVASLVGQGVAECWCGEVFDRLAGCPAYYG